MILVDSSVWIDYFRDVRTIEAGALDELLSSRTVLMGDLILTEVLQGCVADKDYRLVRTTLSVLPIATIGGARVAVKAAENFRWLQARGITVRKTIDTLIATHCILNGHALLASDRDFEPFFEHLGLERA